MSTKKVFIKPIPRKSVLGVHEFDNNGVKMHKTKVKPNCKDKLPALFSRSKGRFLTGLEEYVDNPYLNATDLSQEFEFVKDKEKITRQTLLEIKHQKPKGYYNSIGFRKADSKKKESELSFFSTFTFSLIDGSTILDMNIPDEEIAYWVAMESPKIANSLKEVRENKWPKATHYIASEDEDEDIKYNRNRAVDIAKGKLNDTNVTPEWLSIFCKVLELGKGEISAKVAYNTLSEYLEKGRSSATSKNVEKFEEVLKLFSNPVGKEELTAKALLSDLEHYRIVYTRAGSFLWAAKDITLGHNKTQAIDYILNPEHQEEVEEMRKAIKAKLIS